MKHAGTTGAFGLPAGADVNEDIKWLLAPFTTKETDHG